MGCKTESTNKQTRKTNKTKLTDTDNSDGDNGVGGTVKGKGARYMVTEEDMTSSGEHTI